MKELVTNIYCVATGRFLTHALPFLLASLDYKDGHYFHFVAAHLPHQIWLNPPLCLLLLCTSPADSSWRKSLNFVNWA